MPITSGWFPNSHPEFVVELLRWLVEVRQIHERRGFRYIPLHDAILLALLNTGTEFPWTTTCQLQFENVNAEMNYNFIPNLLALHLHAHRDLTSATPAVNVPHQVAAPLPVNPSRRLRRRPLSRGEGNELSNSVPPQLNLVRASPPYRTRRSRTISASQRLPSSGPALHDNGVTGPPNPRCALQRVEASSSMALDPATGSENPTSPQENGAYSHAEGNSPRNESEDDKCTCGRSLHKL